MTPTRQYGVLASRWPLGGAALYTIVNRNEYGVMGEQIAVPRIAGMRYFDVYHGVELQPRRDPGGADVLEFALEGKGFGALLATVAVDADLERHLAAMRAMTARPLSAYHNEWKPLPQRMVEQGPSPRSRQAPEGMRTVPAGLFDFKVTGIAVEGINQAGVDVQYPWEDQPRRFHRRTMQLPSFHIDTYPVTNAQYKAFIEASGYVPRDTQNYLRHWKDGGFAPELARRPVVWVSLDDARAYARWAGKRLPTSWEWQYAAQGGDGRLYPRGNTWDAGRVPTPDTRREPGPPAPVDAHPGGASPFGVMDLVGNVWQWTDEFSDEHTRAAVLRGGSIYRPQGSHWYFPQAQRLDQHGKFLLMSPSMDRNAMTGFRCVKDAEQ